MSHEKCHCGQPVFTESSKDKCIFHCEKTEKNGWFDFGLKGHKEWDLKRVTEFWKDIREKKMHKKDYNFERYIFPYMNISLERTLSIMNRSNVQSLTYKGENVELFRESTTHCFFEKNNPLLFDRPVNFMDAIFMGRFFFNNIVFKKKVNFMGANFKECVNINNNVFFDDVDFLFLLSEQGLSFEKNKVFGSLNFQYSKFFEKLQFSNINTNEFLNFSNIKFPLNCIIKKSDLSNASFIDSEVGNIIFEECTFTEILNENNQVAYELFNKNDNYNIQNIERLYTQFQKNFAKAGEVSESVKFALGKMRLGKKRIKEKFKNLKQENPYKKKEYENREKEELIFLYAELKKRFDNLSLYNEADDFYKKEFEERTKKNGGWYYFYKWFSDYNTSITKVLIWLFGSIIYFAFIYLGFIQYSLISIFITNFLISLPLGFLVGFTFNEINKHNEKKTVYTIVVSIVVFFIGFYLFGQSLFEIQSANVLENLFINIKTAWNFETTPQFFLALQYSFTSTIPFLNSPTSLSNYPSILIQFIHYFQMIFSTILWALLILTFRRKFKRGGE